MVDAGEIFAEIDASAGMVRFLEDPEQYTSPDALQRLNTTIQASFALAEKLQSINTQVSHKSPWTVYPQVYPHVAAKAYLMNATSVTILDT